MNALSKILQNDSEVILQAYHIMQEENWFCIDQCHDQEYNNRYVVDLDKTKELIYKGLNPEEIAIARDTIDKSRLSSIEKLFINLILEGFSASEIASLFDLSVQRVYQLFKSISIKLLKV